MVKPHYNSIWLSPGSSLCALVDSYCILTPCMPVISSIPWHIMPDGASHILFHVYNSGSPDVPSYHSRLVFVGPRSVHLFTDRTQRTLSFIARLKPGISLPYLPDPLFEMHDRSRLLDDFIPGDLSCNRERLTKHALGGQFGALIQRLEQVFLHILRPPPPLVSAAIEVIDKSGGQRNIGEISRSLGVSARHIRNVFKKAVGLSPKRYARIVRITETMRLADTDKTLNGAALAASGGFFDQSHMIEEFHALLGERPEAFIARPNREEIVPITSVFSNT